ncbi:hypothetical protein Csp1_27290 [Corynebacterium provencense]|uniref:(2E)-enoyl-[ACP] glycyltransferase n=1 Tax=Corynebacterium provencense TaxID=1737425 RepID=A0A2Z3YR52_9CORY|nr:FcoT family thioesterase [Corynebacterium provencense]AWT27472.1 hypothetical protein Csp1_27290 [Corynebacterium provencense]
MTGKLAFRPGDDLFDRAVEPYRSKNSVYLRSCEMIDSDGDTFTTVGQFRIGESCYIDDTGHFNAAEFVISYNQLMYTSLAAAVSEWNIQFFSGWTPGDFWRRQLPDVLIQELWSRYSRPINARAFTGRFRVEGTDTSRTDRGILKLRTSVEFTDDNGGRARGTVLLALTNIPRSSGR